MEATSEDILYTFKTVQTNAIRILFESLKTMLSDVNFRGDNNGLKLTAIDGSQNAIINLILNNERFEHYECRKPVNIGLNLMSVFKILKSIKNADTISFTILESDSNYLYIITENTDKKTTISSKVKLLDIDEKIYTIPDITFDSCITMSSSDFQSYISELAVISNEVEIESTNNNLQLKARGDFAEQTIKINENNTYDNTDINKKEYGKYNIKFIQLFTKSTNLCGTVEIFLKTGNPFTLVYNVANLGQIKYCLVPIL